MAEQAEGTHKIPVISAREGSKIFNPGKDEKVVALQDIDLDVVPGEFVSLIGPSGWSWEPIMTWTAISPGLMIMPAQSPAFSKLLGS